MKNSNKKMLREVNNDTLTPKKYDEKVQSEIFGQLDSDLDDDGLDYDDQMMII